ncbi:MAG TPA: DUF2125 domain-containing protein [Aliidongia sp.]|nr:DUF2125 domain-containing protein [Aliidongia sp.]
MFRPRSKLAAGVALTAVLVALYSALWLLLAHRAERAVDAYMARQRDEGVNLSAATETLGGFPFRIEVRLTGIVADGLPHEPNGHLTVPSAFAWAHPWHLSEWRFALLGGSSIELPQGRITFDLLGGHAGPILGPGATPGGDLADFHVDNVSMSSGGRTMQVSHANLTVRLPPTAPHVHEEPLFSLAFQARKISLPNAVAPLGQVVDHLQLEGTWRGPLPPGGLPAALAGWRDDGGTIDLQSVDLGWGALTLSADGTMALDKDLQPLGAFSARIMGYDAVLDALIANGSLKPNEAALVRMGLSMMALRGADGTPQLKSPLTIQDSAVFLGPARLAKLERIAW